MQTRYLSLAVLSIALASALACTCGSPDAPAPPPPSADGPRDMLVVGTIADLGNLNPVTYETHSDATVMSNLQVPVLDSTFDCRITFTPMLAKSWDWSDDGKTLHYTLRDDITWSDGEPVTADDIAFSFELAANPAVASPFIGFIDHMEPGFRPKVIDDHHLAFTFTKVMDHSAAVAETAAVLPTPRHAFQGVDPAALRGHPRSLDPLVSGPFALTARHPDDRFILEPNPAFTGPDSMKAKLARVLFRVIPDYNSRLFALKNGEIDYMTGISVADADALAASNPEIEIHEGGWRSLDYIGWNLQDARFADVRVRKALALAVDVPTMMKELLQGADGTLYARQATGTITPELCDAYNDQVQPLPYDLQAAKALLAEAGWTDTDADGVVDKDGQPFRFTMSTNAGNERREAVLAKVQHYLAQVGVQVELQTIEGNAFYKSLGDRQFEAAAAGWEAALFVDPTPFWRSDDAGEHQRFNFTSYANPAVDALIAKGMAMPDPADSAMVWRELQQEIYDDQPYLFLWWRTELVGVHERFENVQINLASKLHHLWEWEVPPDKVKYRF